MASLKSHHQCVFQVSPVNFIYSFAATILSVSKLLCFLIILHSCQISTFLNQGRILRIISFVPFLHSLLWAFGDVIAHMQQNDATALIWAAVEGHPDCVRVLMEAGADIDAAGIVRSCFFEFLLFSSFICFQDTPLRKSLTSSSCVSLVLSDRGTPHFCQPQDEWTALIWAASFGHTDCVRLLVEGGADKNAKNSVRLLISE